MAVVCPLVGCLGHGGRLETRPIPVYFYTRRGLWSSAYRMLSAGWRAHAWPGMPASLLTVGFALCTRRARSTQIMVPRSVCVVKGVRC